MAKNEREDYDFVLKKYGKENIVLAPPEYGLPVGSRIAIRSKDAPKEALYPSSSEFPMPKMMYDRRTKRSAMSQLVKHSRRHDCVCIDEKELQQIVIKESLNYKELPLPFVDEPLESFTARIDYNDATGVSGSFDIHYAPTRLHPVLDKENIVFITKVDFSGDIVSDDIEVATTGFISGSIGLAPLVREHNIFAVGLYYITKTEKVDTDIFALVYFVAQNAFYVCPERIIESIAPVNQNGNLIESSNQKKEDEKKDKPRINNVKVRHVIYIGDPNTIKKKITRHTDCWYVRGCVVHRKDGKTYFRRGHYKGPKRDDPHARRRTKNYRIEKDCV